MPFSGEPDAATRAMFALTYQTRQFDSEGSALKGGPNTVLRSLADPPEAAVAAEAQSLNDAIEREQDDEE